MGAPLPISSIHLCPRLVSVLECMGRNTVLLLPWLSGASGAHVVMGPPVWWLMAVIAALGKTEAGGPGIQG